MKRKLFSASSIFICLVILTPGSALPAAATRSAIQQGFSPGEVEQDLRAQLTAAGYEDPQVSVELAPDETSIRIESTTDQGSGSRKVDRRMVRKDDGGDFDLLIGNRPSGWPISRPWPNRLISTCGSWTARWTAGTP